MPAPHATKILSHRANGFGHLENSLAAIKAGLASKADGVELDVRQTKDGAFIILHDSYLDRVSTHTGLIRDYTRAQLQRKKLVDGQPLCFLTDIIPLLKQYSSKTIILELKESGMEEQLTRLLIKHNLTHVILAAWTPHSISQIKRFSTFKTLLLYVPLPRLAKFIRFEKKYHFESHPVSVMVNKLSTDPKFQVLFHSHIPAIPLDGIIVASPFITPHLQAECARRKLLLIGIAYSARGFQDLQRKGVFAAITDRPRAMIDL